jgi:S1-C subfamily serine protease
VRGSVPHALFYVFRSDVQQVVVIPSRVDVGITKTDMDLGLLRLHPHTFFPQGYPTVSFEDFDQIHEGMDIATCGFPLGNMLFQQLGTVTSSFSRGIVSSIIPTSGAARQHVTGFQLDLRATHGNSGGPAFSWDTGQVFGVLQGGVNDDYGNHLFSRAESVYRMLDLGIVDEVLQMQHPPEADL